MKSPLEQDHYEVLEIGRAASLEEIERAYRVVRETYDGDNLALYSMFADRDAAQIRERIDEAYRVLSDEGKRHDYDAADVPSAQPNARFRAYEEPAYWATAFCICSIGLATNLKCNESSLRAP